MMNRTNVDGQTLNQRTADMLKMWEFNSLTHYFVVQGSYNKGGVSQSAGTHDGGGALDISVTGLGSTTDKKWHVKQGRLAGFAAYYRPTISGLWNEHIHAIAIGDPEASSGAKSQMAEYRAGGDGLVGSRPDPDPRVSPIPVWPVRPLKKISALVAYRQFRAKKPKSRSTVKRIQWVLNEKLGTNLPVDGVAGPLTRAAYKKWEKRIDAPSADGVPGKFSLNKLGEGRFKTTWASYEKARKNDASKDRARRVEASKPTFPKK
jgi:hypothetical protein